MDHGERFNSISHAVGTVLATVCGALLVTVTAIGGDPWMIVACGIYALTLLILYLTSTLYHGLRGPAKDLLRKMDHCAIYLLIAGTRRICLAGGRRAALYGRDRVLCR
jgi:hemolysin III